ncbi:MAG: hypothetical protein OEV94_03005 [Deltaproteobacteria bacterium]|nr:hypothetical protein [Deltaproteobacteria bacterium]
MPETPSSAPETAWTPQAVRHWLDARRGQRVALRHRGTTLRVEGECLGVEELDACGTRLWECHLKSPLDGMSVSLTFHESSVSLHVRGEGPNGPCLVMAGSLAYSELILEDPSLLSKEPPKKTGPNQPDDNDPLSWSPYELLH